MSIIFILFDLLQLDTSLLIVLLVILFVSANGLVSSEIVYIDLSPDLYILSLQMSLF